MDIISIAYIQFHFHSGWLISLPIAFVEDGEILFTQKYINKI